MADLVLRIRNTQLIDAGYRQLRNAISGPGWGGFHRDRIYRGLVLDLFEGIPSVTSFVETGTFRGYSTELVASARPTLPVFTVEVVESTYARSARALRRYRNVTAQLGSSDVAVREWLNRNRIGNKPLFYLDAHWQTYWPLRNELKAIGEWGGKAAIIIDDFEVPAQPQFGYDIDGGGDRTAGEKCNLDYIRPALSTSATYHAIFPRYSAQDAFGPPGQGLLRGHITLFQNMPDEYADFIRRPLAQRYYTPAGEITATPPATASG